MIWLKVILVVLIMINMYLYIDILKKTNTRNIILIINIIFYFVIFCYVIVGKIGWLC